MKRWLRILFRPWRRAYLLEAAWTAETVRRICEPAAPGITRDHVVAGMWHCRRFEQSVENIRRLKAWELRVLAYPYQPVSSETP